MRFLPPTQKRIDVQALFAIPSFVDFYKGGSPESDAENKDGPPSVLATAASGTAVAQITPEEQIDALLITQNTALRDDLLHRILQNSPSFFEGVILDLLVGMGYGGSRLNAAHQLGRTGDGGIDGVINEDALGLDRVYVQAKTLRDGKRRRTA